MLKVLLGWFAIFMVVAGSGAEAGADWPAQRDPEYGFIFTYPADLFVPMEGDRPSFYYFRSQQTDAKFLIGAWNNEKGATPEEFKRWMLTHAEGYEDITYQPRGRSWYVVSGYRGDQIYYEKTLFSCAGRVVNVFAIAYPEVERERFDPIVERMEDNFKIGKGCGGLQNHAQ